MTSQNAARSVTSSMSSAKRPSGEPKAPAVPWRERPLLPMAEGARIAGISIGGIYNLAAKGELALKRFGGRTMIETASLAAALDGAETWSASPRTEKATAARAERSRAAWAD